MCKALEELEEKGRIEGRREGEIKGEIKNKILLIQKKSQRGDSINLSRVPRPYFNMGVGECVLTDTSSFPLILNILFYCVQTVFTNR